MLDLDGLKLINDTHGHPVGAHTIAEVGKIIGAVVSPHGRRLPLRRRRVRRLPARTLASATASRSARRSALGRQPPLREGRRGRASRPSASAWRAFPEDGAHRRAAPAQGRRGALSRQEDRTRPRPTLASGGSERCKKPGRSSRAGARSAAAAGGNNNNGEGGRRPAGDRRAVPAPSGTAATRTQCGDVTEYCDKSGARRPTSRA